MSRQLDISSIGDLLRNLNSTRTFSGDSNVVIREAVAWAVERFPSLKLKYSLRSWNCGTTETDVIEVKLIASYELDEEKPRNPDHFRYFNSILCHNFNELACKHDPSDAKFYHNCSKAEVVSKEKILVPFWYLLEIEIANIPQYTDNCYEMTKFLSNLELRSFVPTLELNRATNERIQILAANRKIANLKTQIDNLQVHLKRNLNESPSRSNIERLGTIRAEIGFLRTKMERLQRRVTQFERETDDLKPIPSMQPSGQTETKNTFIYRTTKLTEVQLPDGTIDFQWVEVAKPAMDMPNETEVIPLQSENTAIDVPVIPDTGMSDVKSSLKIPDLVNSDQVHKYPDLTSRWMPLAEIEIGATVTRGATLAQFHLPYDFVKRNWTTNSMLPFRSYDLFAGGMELMFMWNVPKTSAVAITGGFVPFLLQHDRPQDYQTISTISQQPGILMNGHATAEAHFDANWVSYIPSLPIRYEESAMSLYMGTFTLKALTAYEPSTGAPDHVTLRVMARFKDDLCFYGQLEQLMHFPSNPAMEYYQRFGKKMQTYREYKNNQRKTLAKSVLRPSMLASLGLLAKSGVTEVASATVGAATNVATGVVSNLFGTVLNTVGSVGRALTPKPSKHRGHKPNDHSNVIVTQRTAPNLAGGQCEFSCESLRLISKAETPQNTEFFGLQKVETLRDIITINGFVTSFTIKDTHKTGDLLFQTFTQPGVEIPFTGPTNFGNGIENWAPVDHFQAWFANYSGECEYRFVFVCNGFVTCRIRTSYCSADQGVEYDDTTSLYTDYHSINSSLDSSLIYTRKVEYINPLSAWTTDSNGLSLQRGTLSVFLEIPVSQMTGGFHSFDVLVYKSAKFNLSMAIPIPCRTGLIAPSVASRLVVNRSGNDFTVQLGAAKTSAFQLINGSRTVNITGLTQFDSASGLFFWVPGDGTLSVVISLRRENEFGATILGPRPRTNTQAGLYTVSWSIDITGTPVLNVLTPNSKIVRPSMLPLELLPTEQNKSKTLPYFPVSFVKTCKRGPISPNNHLFAKQTRKIFSLPKHHAKPCMDVRFDSKNVTEVTPESVAIDESLYGETHMDIAMNMQRSELWYQTPQIIVEETNVPLRVFRFCANFGAPVVRDELGSMYWNNKQTMMHDCFRFTRGSLDYLLELIESEENAGIYTIIHKPLQHDPPLTHLEQLFQTDNIETGYGETRIASSQNKMVSFTVPQYFGGNGLLNGTYFAAENLTNLAKSLGTVEIWYTGPAHTFSFRIMRAWAPDVSMSGFIGIPARTIYTRNRLTPRRKADHYLSSEIQEIHNLLHPPTQSTTNNADQPRPSGPLDSIKQVSDHLMSIDVEAINRAVTSAENSMNSIRRTADQSTDFINKMDVPASISDLLTTVGLQLAHIYVNPCKQTAALSIAQILLGTGLFKYALHTIDKIKDRIVALFDDRVRPSLHFEEATEIGSLLITGISSFFSVKGPVDIGERLNLSFLKGATLYERVHKYMTAIIAFIEKVIFYIGKTFFPDWELLKNLQENKVQDWFKETALYIDETVIRRIRTDREAVSCLYDSIRVGEEFEMKFMASKARLSPSSSLVSRRLAELRKIRNKIAPHITTPVAKYNPFVLYIYGESCVGKSFILDELAKEFRPVMPTSKQVITKNRTPFYVPMNKYWDNYDSHDIIIFDDFHRISNPQDPGESEEQRFLCLKGPAEMDVPKADIESKGMKVTATTVFVASNHGYPRVNGVLPEVLFNRRDSLWSVKSHFEKMIPCGLHVKTSYTNTCIPCKTIPHNARILSVKEHLSFVKMEPSKEGQQLSVEMSFEEFKSTVMKEMVAYYDVENEHYSKRLKDKNTSGDETLCPLAPFDDLTKITDEMRNRVAVRYGASAPYLARPSMLATLNLWNPFRGRHHYRDSPDYNKPDVLRLSSTQIDECVHYAFMEQVHAMDPSDLYAPTIPARIIFLDDCWRITSTVEGKAAIGQIHVYSNIRCCSECRFIDDPDMNFIARWFEIYTDHGFNTLKWTKVPLYYPQRYWPDDPTKWNDVQADLNQSMAVKRFGKALGLVAFITAWLAIGSLTVHAINKAEERKDRITDTLIEMTKSSKETLMPSMTAFLPGSLNESGGQGPSRDRVKRHKFKVARGNFARPSMRSLEDDHRRFKENCLQINLCGEVALQAFAISKNVFMTQAHAMNSFLHRWTKKVKVNVKETMTVEEQVAIARSITFDLEFFRRGEKKAITYTMERFLKENGYTILFCSNTDQSIFTVNVGHLECTGMFDNVISEKDSYGADLSVLRFRVDSRGHTVWDDITPARDIRFLESQLSYDAADCPWAEELGGITNGTYDYSFDGFTIENMFGQDSLTMCGSALVDNYTGKIVGIMCASSGSRLWFNAISQEQLQHYGVVHNYGLKSMEKVLAKPASYVVRSISPPTPIFHAVKNSIIPSTIHGVAPVTKRPSKIQVDGDRGRASYERAIEQYKPHKHFDFNLDDVYDDVRNLFLRAETDLEFSSKRTLEEAIVGIEGKVARIYMSTSAGYPWCATSTLKDKKKLIYYEDDKFVGVAPELDEILQTEHRMMEKGLKVDTYFQVSHKDELLANPDKVRIIQGSPLSYSIHSRQYLMDFNYMFQFARKRLQHCIGINVFSTEWDYLARTLLAKGKKILVGDYSKFGPRLYTPFVEKSYEVMNAWYHSYGANPRDQFIRSQLSKRVVNSQNIAYSEVVEFQCGSPSGAINTVIINSMCNLMYLRTAWKGIMAERRPELQALHHFAEHVEVFVYGDDVIMSITDEICDDFNNETLSEFFARYDIKYTDVLDKNMKIRKWCSIEEAQFLKMGFKLYTETAAKGGIWIAQPPFDDVKNIVNWIRKPKGQVNQQALNFTHEQATIVNCETAFRSMWFAGRDEFNAFQDKILRVFQKRELKPEPYTFDGLQLQYGIPLKNATNQECMLNTKAACMFAHPDVDWNPDSYQDLGFGTMMTKHTTRTTDKSSTVKHLRQISVDADERTSPKHTRLTSL